MAMPETVLNQRRNRLRSTRLPDDFTITPRPFSSELQQAVRELTRAVRQAPITEEDILRSPSFRAQQQAIDFARREREAATRRDLASRGILRSTPSVQALEAEGARADAAIAAAVPQLLEAARAREAQRINNLINLIQTQAGLESEAFQQGLSEFSALAPFRFQTPGERFQQAAAEASLTGRYLPPDVSDLYQQVIDLKQQAAANPAQVNELRRAADEIRAQIAARGYDPSIVGANVSLDQALRNLRSVGTITPAQRQLEAALTGIDPVTGRPTFEARQAQLAQDRLALQSQPEPPSPLEQLRNAAATRIASGQGTEADYRILGLTPPSNVAPPRTSTSIDQRATQRALARFSGMTDAERYNLLTNPDLLEQLAEQGVDLNKLYDFMRRRIEQIESFGADASVYRRILP